MVFGVLIKKPSTRHDFPVDSRIQLAGFNSLN